MAGSKKYWVDFVEKDDRDMYGYTLIEGFPGMGLVGTIAAKYLVEKLGFEQTGHIDSNAFVPIIRIHEGRPVHPSRIYVNSQKKLVAIVSEQLIPQNLVWLFAKELVDWIEDKGIERVVSLAGIKADDAKGGEKIYGMASNRKAGEFLEKNGIEIINEGITTGVNALIMLDLKDKDIQAVSILGKVQISADYKAAASLLRKLDEMIGLKLDVEPLMKEAKETEKALLSHLEAMKKTGDEIKKLEDKTVQTPMFS